jgi:fatty acid desaturase
MILEMTMELFRFLAWQWNRFDFEEISLMFSAMAAILVVFVSAYVGLSLGWLIFNAVSTLICAVCFCALVFHTREQWRKYKSFKEREAQQIVDKLRGRSY